MLHHVYSNFNYKLYSQEICGCRNFYFCLFLGSIDDHFTIYSRTYLIFLTLHDIMQFYTIYRNNTKAKKIKIKEVYTTNDKYCNQSQNRLNLNILLRDHEYPAYFLIDYTFSRMCSYLQTMLVQNWLRSYQLNFLLYKHHVSLRIFILIFHFEATNTFFHHQYIFHLLMDCLSNISKHDTFTCQKGYKKEPHSPFHF